MDAEGTGHRVRCGLGFKIVLRFPISLVVQVIHGEINLQSMPDSFRRAEVHDIKSRRKNPGIKSVQSVCTDMPITQGTVEPLPLSDSETGVCNRMRGTVNVDSWASTSIKRIGHLSETAIQTQLPGNLH